MTCNEPESRRAYELGLKTPCSYCDAQPGDDCTSIITNQSWTAEGGWAGQHRSRWARALRDAHRKEAA
ncbi:hypothetical protein [Streptomyces sp. NPDC050535]|uniref:zinc finger domain-containing protein n=1 Tax=Streptomyces sp. NPDC050535 TaxID=3365626 RepID=UPI0037AAD97E